MSATECKKAHRTTEGGVGLLLLQPRTFPTSYPDFARMAAASSVEAR